MNNNSNERLILEDYENKFFYKKNTSNLNITFNRIAFIFFIFLIVCIVYSIKVFYLGSLSSKNNIEKTILIKTNYRADILDKNGNFLVKTVNTVDIGINPKLVIDKQKFLIKLQLIFPEKNFDKIKKKLDKNKFFYLEKKN